MPKLEAWRTHSDYRGMLHNAAKTELGRRCAGGPTIWWVSICLTPLCPSSGQLARNPWSAEGLGTALCSSSKTGLHPGLRLEKATGSGQGKRPARLRLAGQGGWSRSKSSMQPAGGEGAEATFRFPLLDMAPVPKPARSVPGFAKMGRSCSQHSCRPRAAKPSAPRTPAFLRGASWFCHVSGAAAGTGIA